MSNAEKVCELMEDSEVQKKKEDNKRGVGK